MKLNLVKFKSSGEGLHFEDGKAWLSQKQLALVLGVKLSSINEHVSGCDLTFPESVKKIKITSIEGARLVTRNKLHYSLEFAYGLSIKLNKFDASRLMLESAKEVGIDIAGFVPLDKKESVFSNLLESSLRGVVEFELQYVICGYRIDMYCHELQLAVEYDEKYHRKGAQSEKDHLREQVIMGKVQGLSFIRVKEGKEVAGLNEIIKFVIRRTMIKSK